MKKLELFETVIKGMNSKLNKKALKEVLEQHEGRNDLNRILFDYYRRANYVKGDDNLIKMVYRDEFNSDEWFRKFIKNMGGLWYKKPYDYKKLGKIKQKNTGLVLIYDNGYMTWCSYGFDVYAYVMTNQITVED